MSNILKEQRDRNKLLAEAMGNTMNELKDGNISFEEAKATILADLQNELLKLRKELEEAKRAEGTDS